jgi:hypothetical protein
MLDIIEENKRLKDWYTANGFIDTGTKKFENLPFTTGCVEWEVKINGQSCATKEELMIGMDN